MNNIYVDELPIKVAQRVIHFEDGKLNCVELMFDSSYKPREIQLITDRLAEERKKVVQSIRDEIKKLKKSAPKHDIGYDCDDVLLSYLEISEILDQIERNEDV